MNRNNQLLAVLILTLLACFTSDAQAVYHPKLGRWMQQDPLGRDTTMQQRLGTSAMPTTAFVPRDNLAPTPAGGYHDGMSLYEYVRGRPLSVRDYTGLWGADTHYDGTKEWAKDVGFSKKCAQHIAWWNKAVDDWTPAGFFSWYHFNEDVDGNKYGCGRDCHAARRWRRGRKKIDNAEGERGIWAGLADVGKALHSYQDGFAHIVSHQAQNPFEHAPSVICFFRGDGFGILYDRCKKAKKTHPNWGSTSGAGTTGVRGYGRPDDVGKWAADHRKTKEDTIKKLRSIFSIPKVKCLCSQ